ncbi:MAG: adenine-specific DNA-methyltransferase [Myxococcota bacterium]|jgi:adenine-specific DNA-methyltransferase
MIKYIGSKRTLVPTLVEVISGLPGARSVIDLFSGTSRVGIGLKTAGLQVLSNDLNTYAATIARCYVAANNEDHAAAAEQLAALSELEGVPGYFTRTFCEESRFFQPRNGARVDAIRDAIEEMDLTDERKAVLLVSLMEAADRVDSTTGVQMAYLKQWAPRANRDLTLRMPVLLPQAAAGKGEAHQLDAQEAAQTLSADVAYLDPPYNQHKYLGNYHIWETLVRWDAPEAYGIARKRIDCRQRKSPFNSRPGAAGALKQLIQTIDARHLVVSFSDEGYIPRPQMEELLSERGEVTVLVNDFRRYVGARIGIYSPDGEKVGKVSHLRNKEFIYVVKGR